MGMIGCLGDIVFHVSSESVETIKNAVWSGSANFAVHKRHGGPALTEFTGRNPDKFTLDIELSAWEGINPMAEIKKVWKYERNGIAVPLTIGDHGYGYYRWNIVGHKSKLEEFDGNGNLIKAKLSLQLQEYLKG